MQIPELNLFWLLVGAFVAAAATWILDHFLIKGQQADGVDQMQLNALNEKARMVEPLNQQLQFARSQVHELEAKLNSMPDRSISDFDLSPYTARIDDLTALLEQERSEKMEISTMLSSAEAGAGQAEELGATLLQLRQDLAAKEAETGELVVNLSQLKNENEALRHGAAGITPELESLRDKLTQTENEAFGAKSALAELKARFESMQSAELSVEPELIDLRQRVLAAETEAEALKSQLLTSQSVPDLREEFAELKEKLHQVESQRESSISSLAELRDSEQTANAQLAQLQKELTETITSLQSAKNSERALEEELTQARQTASEATLVRAQIAAMTSNLEKLEMTNFEQGRELDDLRAQLAGIDEMRSEYEKFSTRLPELERASMDREELAQQVGRLERQLIEQDEIIENFKSQAQRANAEASQNQSAVGLIKELEAEIERLNRRNPELESLIAELREELGEKASRIEKLEAVAGTVEAVDNEATELRSLVQNLSSELDKARKESQEIRTALVKVQAEAEILRESTGELETVKSENIRLKNFVESTEISNTEIAPLRNRINDLFAHLEESNRENEGNRKALNATMEELRRLRQDMGDLSRLREENAQLRVMKQIGGEPKEFETLKLRISDVASQLNQTKNEAFDAKEQLAAANREISRLRAELLTSSEMGELS